MKKAFFLLINFLLISQLTTAQSVTLATTIPVSPTKGTVVYNNGTNQLQYWNGTAWIPITNAASGTGWALSGTHIYNNNTGNVGIGITNPTAKLHIKTETGGYGMLHTDGNISVNTYIGSGYAWLGTNSNHPLTFYTNNSNPLMTIGTNGNVGVGISSPLFKMDISDRIRLRSGSLSNTAGLWLNNPDNSAAIGFIGTYNATSVGIYGSSGWGVVMNTSTGNVGIGSSATSTTNKLQIGSMGGTGYAGNDIAIGNGTNATGLYQSNDDFQIASTTKILLRPNNGYGLVGINTLTPRAPLDVANVANVNSLSNFYTNMNEFAYGASAIGFTKYESPPGTYAPNVSIVAQGQIYALSLSAYSDSRIKNIKGISNSAKDLETIKALQITDYTLKDKIQNGNKIYKKVIAQQVEKVFPQAVSKVTDVVPDIYALAEKVVFDETNKTLRCSLLKSYDIKVGEKIEFVHPKEGKIKAEVIEVSDNSFTVKDWQQPTDKIFVYGREVNDFRSVDYEAISMLGISAIQQLAKENEALKTKFTTENDLLKKQIADLNIRFEHLEAMMTKEIKTNEKLNN